MSRGSAILFDAAADRLLITSGMLDYSAAYAVMADVYLASDPGDYAVIFSMNANVPTFGNDDDEFGMDMTGANNRWYSYCANTGAAATEVNGGTVVTGRWYHYAVVRESTTSAKVYVDGALLLTNTTNIAGRAANTRMEIGGWMSTNGSPFPGRIANIKVWSASLTQAEVNLERLSTPPVRRRNLYGYYPTQAGNLRRFDMSGFERHWTTSGTLTDMSGPPLVQLPRRRIVGIAPAAPSGGWGMLLSSQRNRLVRP